MNSIGLVTRVLQPLETSSSIGMFVRDTGGCLISRLAISRSSDESREISIAEIAESCLFYFSTPFLAKRTADIYSKSLNIDKKLMTSSLNEITNIDNRIKKNIKLGKFAQIMTTLGIILPLVFAIAPVRNMVTLGKTGKDKFVNVVDLDKSKQEQKSEEARQKILNLVKKLGLSAIGILGTTFGILAFSKNNNFYKTVEPLINKVIKHFDFTKTGDLELKHYGALIYPVSIASYFYASRDKYEVQENIRRFSVTVPLLFFGEKLIQNPIYKTADKIFNTNVFNNGNIKSYKDIKEFELSKRNKSLKAKNLAYGLTFFINTMAIAMGVALLNRYKTKTLYEQEQKQKVDTPIVEQYMRKEIWKDMMI